MLKMNGNSNLAVSSFRKRPWPLHTLVSASVLSLKVYYKSTHIALIKMYISLKYEDRVP